MDRFQEQVDNRGRLGDPDRSVDPDSLVDSDSLVGSGLADNQLDPQAERVGELWWWLSLLADGYVFDISCTEGSKEPHNRR